MAAYMLVEVSIHSPLLYEKYKEKTPAILQAFEGRFVLRGMPVVALEGTWDHDRLVLLEFPNREKALAWYHSAAYQEAKQIRDKASTARFLLIGE
ncbi:MAG: DUF1330 domain-containing protein [Bacteroidetes bacterium]|nr:DUF1330 domain-containing protein [Bacteroidota bacterium]MDA1269457.1 DUF1330 domain-containing protein [Bacteroidota bacterium]